MTRLGGYPGNQRARVRIRLQIAGLLALALTLLATWAAAFPEPARASQLRGVVLTPNFEQPPPAGVTDAQSDHEVAAACGLGSTVARVVMNWNALQPVQGQVDVGYATRIDRMIGGLARCGIPTELTVLGTPCWTSTDPRIGPSYCSPTSWRFPPRDTSAFGDVISGALRRWGSSLAALEVWNEPNSPWFWLGSVQQYVSLVNEAIDVRNAVGSRVPILAGALAGADAGYLRQLYAAGLRGQDGISMHPYTLCVNAAAFANPASGSCRRPKAPQRSGHRSLFRANIANVHRTMLAAGDTGGIWLTEFGYPACPATPYCVRRSTQARWLATSLRLAASLRYVRAAIVFSLRDIGNTLDWNDRFGLLARDFAPRPSYRVIQRIFRRGVHRHRHRSH